MINDRLLRGIYFMVLFLAILIFTGIVDVNNYSRLEAILGLLYFAFATWSIAAGCRLIVSKARNMFRIHHSPLMKIAALSSGTIVCSSILVTAFVIIWLMITNQQLNWNLILNAVLTSAVVVLIFTLIYEILFLTKERLLDNKIVNQLDNERVNAELSVLKNELDPHFMFNSLTTLSHLIHADADKAYLFNSKLAEVYKYILINKDRELISVNNELEFIEDYFFLLHIRHEEKMILQVHPGDRDLQTAMILPCALQILVENAIKHNDFSGKEPLNIDIAMNGEYIQVMNNVKPKPYLVNSTKIGLKNLSDRYKLTCNKNIAIQNKNNHFIVKLPLIKQT